ncbi:MAG: hypothetical protein VR68_12090 [Peptococcaceae bacterium BRH_c4a]|nr:MAG: hypothetical protein VR68_12090 [Peptococcaceae bacterium BRH_c4a]
MKVTIDKNKTVQLFNRSWVKAGVIRDMRYNCISFWMKIDGDYTLEELQEIVAMVRLEFDGADGTKPITYNTYLKSFNSTGWVRVFLYPWNIKSLDRNMDKICRLKLVFDTNNTGSLKGPFTVCIDDITLIPIISGGKVCFSADDGHSSWESVENILNQYGYKGCYNVFPAKDYADGEHYSDILDTLKKITGNGGEIASHSYTHDVHKNNLWEELTRSKETLQKDHLGEINFMGIPGGYSIWTGDMIADCHQVYFGVRSTLPSICSKGEKVPVFSTVPIILSDNLESIKNKIAWAVNNHENVALYFHRLDGIDMNEARLHDICEWLYDKGIPVVKYSHMFPDRK